MGDYSNYDFCFPFAPISKEKKNHESISTTFQISKKKKKKITEIYYGSQKDVNCRYIRNTLVYSVKNFHYIKKKKKKMEIYVKTQWFMMLTVETHHCEKGPLNTQSANT